MNEWMNELMNEWMNDLKFVTNLYENINKNEFIFYFFN